jgi:hypothetical protein
VKASIVPSLAILAVGVYISARALHAPVQSVTPTVRSRSVDGRQEFAMDWTSLEGFAALKGERKRHNLTKPI